MESVVNVSEDEIIQKFKMYSISHPNLSKCWLAYLGPKKRHYDEDLKQQCFQALKLFESGSADMREKDIIRVLLYKQSV
jgi:hypothetical protein